MKVLHVLHHLLMKNDKIIIVEDHENLQKNRLHQMEQQIKKMVVRRETEEKKKNGMD
jgi:hypothetical protein